MGPPEVPAFWTVYLASDDADDTAGKITAAGGKVLVTPMDVLDVGRMAVAADPPGAVFGVWQARSHTGFGLANEPGSVCWNENFSRDMDGNQAFYHAVFGYEYGDMSTPRFPVRPRSSSTARKWAASVSSAAACRPRSRPTGRCISRSAIPTAAVATVTAAGGTVTREPWDSPYGRMAVVADDQGAAFSLMGTLPAASG
jgi:predicted enzyme related to lactoylglutathione lyase